MRKKYVNDRIDDLIQTKTVSIAQTKNMLDLNVTVDDKSQSFYTPRKYNHSATASNVHIPLGYDTMKFKQNITTHMKRQKLTPPGKEYLCFQNDGTTAG